MGTWGEGSSLCPTSSTPSALPLFHGPWRALNSCQSTEYMIGLQDGLRRPSPLQANALCIIVNLAFLEKREKGALGT